MRSRRLLLSDKKPECKIWRASAFQSREMKELSVLGNLPLLKYLSSLSCPLSILVRGGYIMKCCISF